VSWWNDWGGSGWAADVVQASAQAEAWLDAVATGKGWRSSAVGNVKTSIVQAKEAGSAAAFWADLVRRYDLLKLTEPNADKLRATYASAGGVTTRTDAARESGTVLGVVADTVSESAEDVAEIAEGAGKAVALLKSPIAWVAIGGGLLLLMSRK
jgi:hypothetical protein